MTPFNPKSAGARVKTLSGRQTTVLISVANGLTQKAIAADLGISEKTVSNHLWRIYRHIGAHCIANAVRAAVAAKIVQ